MTELPPPGLSSFLESHCPGVPLDASRAVVELAAAGATVPFIARYRRDRTGGLDADAVRRVLAARDQFDRVLSRQAIIAESIERHAGLPPELRERIFSTFDPDALEDLYHPYRQQKKSRALAAREAGLQPLADWIWNCGHGSEMPQEGQTLELWAFTFRDEEKGVKDARSAIEGARDILVERLAGDPALRALVRKAYFEEGWLRAAKATKAKSPSRYEPYFTFHERVRSLREPAASSRYLAVRRGQAEDELQVSLGGGPDDSAFEGRLVAAFEAAACSVPDSPGAEVLRHAGRIAFKNDVRTAVENEVHRVLKEAADSAASQAFAESVRRRLLEAPFGPRPVLGIDPEGREGGHLAAIDSGGALLATASVRFADDEQKAAARETVARLVREHGLEAVAVGSGGGGREAEVLARTALREAGLARPVVLVSEAGASAWGTSEEAATELPGAEIAQRAAVSIARRLQDPLAELVRLDPRGMGAGPFPHDVTHAVLQRAVRAAVEDCVCAVGVDVNRASRPLLGRVPGLSPTLAAAIVERRAKEGPFRFRHALLEVEGVSVGVFEQAAGFLRVTAGEHPLDATRIHPERYAALEALASGAGRGLADLLGQGAAVVRDSPEAKEGLGAYTWQDVVSELESPGHDPRPSFEPFSFREDVLKLEDLKPGLACPGVVTHVTSFGAFVDVGVHHDGLVHVSQLGARPGEPRSPLQAGDRVLVRVLKVDLEKKQISLTMRTPPSERKPARARARGGDGRPPSTDRREAERRPAHARRPPARPAAGPAGGRADRPAPPRERRPPSPPPAERRPESRRPAFNNPFAVLASLKTPPKKG